MTIDEAIETMNEILPKIHRGNTQKEYEAVKLGVEALKFIKTVRVQNNPSSIPTLTGETREREGN